MDKFDPKPGEIWIRQDGERARICPECAEGRRQKGWAL